MVQRQVDRAASQSHRVGRPVLSPLDRSGQGGQASGQQAGSWQNIVAKSQELGSRGHPWIWNFACSVSAVQD